MRTIKANSKGIQRLTIMRRPDCAQGGDERGRQWYHRFNNLDRAFDRAAKVKRYLSWKAPELTGEQEAHDPDWWIDEATTRGEYNARTRAHAAKWRDDWA